MGHARHERVRRVRQRGMLNGAALLCILQRFHGIVLRTDGIISHMVVEVAAKGTLGGTFSWTWLESMTDVIKRTIHPLNTKVEDP